MLRNVLLLSLVIATHQALLVRAYPSAQDPEPALLTPLGQLGGTVKAVAVRGDGALVGVGPRVLALDLRDPAQLVVAGRSPVLPAPVVDIAWFGNLAYVALGIHGIAILDAFRPGRAAAGEQTSRCRALRAASTLEAGCLALQPCRKACA